MSAGDIRGLERSVSLSCKSGRLFKEKPQGPPVSVGKLALSLSANTSTAHWRLVLSEDILKQKTNLVSLMPFSVPDIISYIILDWIWIGFSSSHFFLIIGQTSQNQMCEYQCFKQEKIYYSSCCEHFLAFKKRKYY